MFIEIQYQYVYTRTTRASARYRRRWSSSARNPYVFFSKYEHSAYCMAPLCWPPVITLRVMFRKPYTNVSCFLITRDLFQNTTAPKKQAFDKIREIFCFIFFFFTLRVSTAIISPHILNSTSIFFTIILIVIILCERCGTQLLFVWHNVIMIPSF